jgi:hypothetical protein
MRTGSLKFFNGSALPQSMVSQLCYKKFKVIFATSVTLLKTTVCGVVRRGSHGAAWLNGAAWLTMVRRGSYGAAWLR